MRDVVLGAVVGQPVAHSLSPRLFEIFDERLDHGVAYRRIDVEPRALAELFRLSKTHRLYDFWNVTIPHKETVAKLADRVSPEVRAIGAANVVRFSGAVTHAFNTDWVGVREVLTMHRRSWRGRRAVVIGAGGAARAVVFALGKLGLAEIAIGNRDETRARALARHFQRLFPRSAIVASPRPGVESPADLVVNATPIGLGRESWTLPLPPAAPGALAFDLLYHRADTAFLRAAGRLGYTGADGLGMLIAQALETWELAVGRVPGKAALAHAASRRLRERK